MLSRWILSLFSLIVVAPTFATASCPAPSTVNHSGGHLRLLEFKDGSIAMRIPLEVNSDGAQASYAQGNHGFSYLGDGMVLWKGNGASESCTAAGNRCSEHFAEADRLHFGRASKQFCVFAFAVDGLHGAEPVACKSGGIEGYIVGGGLGAPRQGPTLATVEGISLVPYISLTSLMLRDDQQRARSLDAAIVPFIVAPRVARNRLGQVASLQFNGREVLAVVGDIGPRFGEASIAAHQLLRYGALKQQLPGPISLAQRCTAIETGLLPPFLSRPDLKQDSCEQTRNRPRGAADIRIRAAIEEKVEVIILSDARLKQEQPPYGALLEAVSQENLQRAVDQRHTGMSVAEMRQCLKSSGL
ncbi:hypothetical protein ACIPI6_17270 [Pseudomonas protegens]|uniref:hypothetical protein n=1 Tax=Pseudomonas protegens TaxID=380021 RepID=UPI000F61D684|nr:MAG: hypothetical protein NAG77_09265 [Pseudomonas protegens]WEK23138.1 MAG: hypothetical protein P0Y61_23120 [Pseudomonas protegens]